MARGGLLHPPFLLPAVRDVGGDDPRLCPPIVRLCHCSHHDQAMSTVSLLSSTLPIIFLFPIFSVIPVKARLAVRHCLHFSAIYGMITKLIPTLKRHGLPQDKLDTLIAMGENLIQMKSSNDMQKIEGLTDASANAKSEPSHNLDSKNHEFAHHIWEINEL